MEIEYRHLACSTWFEREEEIGSNSYWAAVHQVDTFLSRFKRGGV